MSDDFPHRSELRLTLRHEGRTYTRAIPLDKFTARCLDPMSPEHDMTEFAFDEGIGRHRRDRRKFAEHMAHLLTAEIMRLAAAQDPIKGYTPEEWKKICKPPKTRL